MIMICASIMQQPLDFAAVELVAGLVAIFSLRELSSRSQLFWTAVLVTFSSGLTNLALEWIRNDDLGRLSLREYNFIIINGMLLFCSYPLLYLIEKAFGFISNITLIELSDMNKALLRKMSEVAPGTFQHSIQVGNLAAEIANKIDGKSQLVRTGALYHDIGKMMNPIYFTENQSGVNPHEKLGAIDSAQMIISHVTEGIKLAEKYNLPTIIKEFITTHHGQGKAKYFYVKYKNEHPNDEVDELLQTREELTLAYHLRQAGALALNEQEKENFELNLLAQITIWGPIGNPVNYDYAWKEWGGLIKTYYSKRWQSFFERLALEFPHRGKFSTVTKKQYNDRNVYVGSSYYKSFAEFERKWLSTVNPDEPSGGDTVAIARTLAEKSAKQIEG